jgi:hypothetical protein
MHLREIEYTGYFEEQDASSAETLQIVAPDGDLEKDLLAWTLLPAAQTVSEDPARKGYAFSYELGRQLDEGVFVLHVSARDASDVEHAAEIAAAVVTTVPGQGQRVHAFSRFWLLSESLHFKPVEAMSHAQYAGAAYGRLNFSATAVLPHRRLFGAAV